MKPLKTKLFKFSLSTPSANLLIVFFLLVAGNLKAISQVTGQGQAYEVIEEEVKKSPEEVLQKGGRIKVDGVAAVVGNYVILESDIDKTLIDLRQNGYDSYGVSRCELLGSMMEDKLYAHQAIQDSIIVEDSEINAMVDQQIGNMVQQLGNVEKAIAFYQKSSIEELRQELFDIDKAQKLSQQMRSKIIDEIEVTPDEVRQFYDGLQEKPQFGAEIEIAQIVIEPQVTKEAEQLVINRLNEFRRDVMDNGSSFASKAILYSQDPGSRSKGGLYVINKQTPFVKEFKDVAFTLQEGEISMPFKTDFGYHIIQLDKIRGKDRELRHILLIPEITTSDMNKAKIAMDSVRNKIINGEISFEDAALVFSSEKETRANGGKLYNPQTLETRLELTKLDPSLYEKVIELKEGEISLPFIETKPNSDNRYYKIIKVLKRYDEHKADYIQDYSRIKELALRNKQIKKIAEWQAEKIKDTYISLSAAYKSCEFTNNWQKK